MIIFRVVSVATNLAFNWMSDLLNEVIVAMLLAYSDK